MMPSPDPGASHGTQDRPSGHADVLHLACPCQLHRRDPVAFCGTSVDTAPADAADVDAAWCAVCWDLARTALVARRCERCPG